MFSFKNVFDEAMEKVLLGEFKVLIKGIIIGIELLVKEYTTKELVNLLNVMINSYIKAIDINTWSSYKKELMVKYLPVFRSEEVTN